MTEVPHSWESLEQHPPLRDLTEEEKQTVGGFFFPGSALTYQLVGDLITLYAKAVGYETEADVIDCITTVGFCRFNDDTRQYDDYWFDEPIDIEDVSRSWRIGSEDWSHTKLVLRRDEFDREVFINPRVYSNTPHDNTDGLTDRDIRAKLYFAEMSRGFLELSGVPVRGVEQ